MGSRADTTQAEGATYLVNPCGTEVTRQYLLYRQAVDRILVRLSGVGRRVIACHPSTLQTFDKEVVGVISIELGTCASTSMYLRGPSNLFPVFRPA